MPQPPADDPSNPNHPCHNKWLISQAANEAVLNHVQVVDDTLAAHQFLMEALATATDDLANCLAGGDEPMRMESARDADKRISWDRLCAWWKNYRKAMNQK